MTRDLDGLPEADRVLAGLADLERNTVSEAALLVAVAAPALRRLGLSVSTLDNAAADPNMALYRWLCESDVADPYRRYNALIRGIVSFVHGLEARRGVLPP